MTPERLTELALEMTEVVQSSHFGTTDFRVRNKVFATLPEPGRAVLKLTLDQQTMLTEAESAVFSPVPNAWGRKGWTSAALAGLDEPTARSMLTMAWGNVAPKALKAGR